jgi:hypothetical protein
VVVRQRTDQPQIAWLKRLERLERLFCQSCHAHAFSPFAPTVSSEEVIAWKCSLPYLAIMKVIRDCFGTSVRLTDERLAHILEHVEMAGMADELERVLKTPSEVRRSPSDDDVKHPSESDLERLNELWL